MIFKIRKLENFFIAPIYSLLINFSSLLKVSFIWGSNAMFFSATNILSPMTGVFCNAKTNTAVFLLRNIFGLIFFKLPLTISIIYHIPTFFASFYLSNTNIITGVVVPLACMLLFMVNPVGQGAFLYAFLWFIPIFIYFFNKNSMFLNFLASTFIAHAVGSVIWIYSIHNLSSAQWLYLIPVVLIERLIFACGMLILYKFFNVVNKRVWYKTKIFAGIR